MDMKVVTAALGIEPIFEKAETSEMDVFGNPVVKSEKATDAEAHEWANLAAFTKTLSK